MSVPKDSKSTPLVEPLKENEMGQIEGGFSEISQDFTQDQSEFNGIGCSTTNESQCGKTTESTK
ncbi:hypothetical protein F0L74_13565 [Chitinophaga agrisoli]|uniref:Uncharacterized protein n=1 Tax=Chitinophaga agrisoli TaxID=2607653 RepID=A0A5B2VWQ1_9BACT|nr:hypothetical protein [Chitinophaga agrisoli]KAA2243515.1 hypothetical protein F0L74_13565 [Chitinophaga agrisoli]